MKCFWVLMTSLKSKKSLVPGCDSRVYKSQGDHSIRMEMLLRLLLDNAIRTDVFLFPV